MKKCLLSVLCLFAVGCLQSPEPVKKANIERSMAVKAYAGSMSMVLAEVLEAYRKAEYAKIEQGVEQVLAANAGKYDAQGIRDLIALRDKKRQDIDAIIVKLQDATALAERNLAIEAKLADAVAEFDNAGPELASMRLAVDEIMGILSSQKGK